MTHTLRLKGFLAASLLAGGAYAGDMGKAVIDDKGVVEDESSICDIFDLSTLYKSDAGFIRSVALIGRYHGQYHSVDSNQGSDSDWENRRVRIGPKIGLANNLTFENNWNLKRDFGSSGDIFDDIDDMFLEWEPNDDFYLVIGKQKPKITQEYGTSSKRILTVERSNIVNTVIPDKLWGVVGGFNLSDRLTQEVGAYLGGFRGDVDFPEWDAGAAAIARTAYALNDVTTVDFDYFYGDQDPLSNGIEEYEHIFSLGTSNDFGGWGLTTDVIFADGIDNGDNDDLFGLVILPYYDLTDKLQMVGRYTYMTSDSDTGVRLQSRYERSGGAAPVNDRGDSYHSFYLGFNYRICGDKLKLLGGVEYATLDAPGSTDWDGWSYLLGVRTYW